MPLAIIRNSVFYLAAAQIIPVVVLALVVLVEFNTRRLREYLPIYLRLIAFLGFVLCRARRVAFSSGPGDRACAGD
jgi:hypothetical protein